MQPVITEEVTLNTQALAELPPSCGASLSDTVSQTTIENPSRQPKIKWPATIFIIGSHLLALAGLFTFSWHALIVCLALHWITGGLGITLCFHRLLTHRSYKLWKPLEYFFAVCGTLACQGGPISWVAAHRLHHAKSDQDGDPHSPLDGMFWAHMGWCLHQNKTIDEFDQYKRFAPDLAKDRFYVFLDKNPLFPTFFLGAALFALGGWSYVIWGIFVRLVFVYHSTWLVNSAAHIWGYQTYKTGDKSTNLWWVALLSYGEGWHNNHHAFQYSARHGLKLWEFDLTYATIKLLSFLKLAEGVKLPAKHLLTSPYAPGKAI